jgi:putative tricarboxylic transport membrane protein
LAQQAAGIAVARGDSKMTPRLRALLPYVLVLAAAGVLSYNALHFGYTPRGDRPGPDVWPRAILLLLVVACVVRIVGVLRRPSAPEPVMLQDVIADALPGDAHDEPKPSPRYPALLLTGIALTIGYVALLGTLGFFIDTVLYIAALTWTGRYRRWPVIAAVAVAGALVFMFIFMKVVYLSLPIGRPPFASVSLLMMQWMGIR